MQIGKNICLPQAESQGEGGTINAFIFFFFFLPLKTAMSGGGGREFFLKVHRKCLINKGKGT